MATTRYQITIPKEIADKLDKKAAEEQRNRSNMIAFILSEYFKENK